MSGLESPITAAAPVTSLILDDQPDPRDLVRFYKPVRSGFGLGRYQTGPNSKFKFEFKKMKNSQKNPKNTSRCDESNGVKFSQKFIRLTYFSGI